MAARLVAWLFLIDDAYAEGSFRFEPNAMRFQNRVLLDELRQGRSVPEGNGPFPVRDTTPSLSLFSQALLSLLNEGETSVGSPWRERFLASLAGYLEGCALEAELRAARRIPSMTEYVRVRLLSIGIHPTYDLIELVEGHALTQEQHQSEIVRAQKDRAATLCAWVNDLYSLSKEREAGCPCNIGMVIRQERGLDNDLAIGDAIAELYNETLEDFHRVETEYAGSPFRSENVAKYFHALKCWVEGNYEWMLGCERYKSAGGSAEEASHPAAGVRLASPLAS
jgi:hypothetical protein